jgi:hypothetical protein
MAVDDTTRFGRVDVAADGTIKSFKEKRVHGPGWINVGV